MTALRLFRTQPKEPEILAAVDLGSNSFHMVVARLSHGQPKVIDRLREMVRLAGGLDANQNLDSGRQEIALACLARFGERLRDIRADSVRVVGTSTLRLVGQHSDFVRRAGDVIGHPVEIISGIEEARLIYQGVFYSSPSVTGRQIVVDIGGGSTEIIIGQGAEADAMESLSIGCVGLSQRAFPDGKLSRRSFKKACLYARLELEPVREMFRHIEPERVSGASGTIRAAHTVLNKLAGTPTTTTITVDGLQGLIDRMAEAGHVDRLSLPGLSAQRQPVFAGGVAILIEIMAGLGLDEMHVSDGALREGLLYDMVSRLTDEDARERTVRSMAGRFNIDERQADRVEKTALILLQQVATDWSLDVELYAQILRWAARLHEIGLHIAHSLYHHHGAYLLEHADMPGFSTVEQRVAARLVGEHRGRLDRQFFADIPEDWELPTRRLTVLLRLAVLFNRSRTDAPLPEIACSGNGRKFSITLSGERADNPLTWADLERERDYLNAAEIKMKLVEPPAD
jgi:exopolyphosphatase/guanosine-5'-triphosphate,3'-diphosphate pyrophosphatase